MFAPGGMGRHRPYRQAYLSLVISSATVIFLARTCLGSFSVVAALVEKSGYVSCDAED